MLSFGVNDTTIEAGARRVTAGESVANLAALLSAVAAEGWPVLVVGPPPVTDREHTRRTADLDATFCRVCREAAVPYVHVLEPLRASAARLRDVAGGDGAHPGAAGYSELADLVWPHWWRWSGPRTTDR